MLLAFLKLRERRVVLKYLAKLAEKIDACTAEEQTVPEWCTKVGVLVYWRGHSHPDVQSRYCLYGSQPVVMGKSHSQISNLRTNTFESSVEISNLNFFIKSQIFQSQIKSDHEICNENVT